HADGAVGENGYRREGRRPGVVFPVRAFAREINDPAHVAADRARGKKTEEHADEVIDREIRQRIVEPDRAREQRPANRAQTLPDEIDQQADRDVRELGVRERLAQMHEIDVREKKGEQPETDGSLEKSHDGILHDRVAPLPLKLSSDRTAMPRRLSQKVKTPPPRTMRPSR